MNAWFLAGATAVGKSAVAQHLAERRGAAILSADSMLIYRGMDIGTAKPSLAERGQVSYYGIDLAGPDERFSVWQYREQALEVLSREPQVIVVGGTGLYLKSLTHGLRSVAGENAVLRSEWEARVAAEGVGVLREHVRRVAPDAFEQLADKDNSRRLIRVLEQAGSVERGSGSVERGAGDWSVPAGGGRMVGLFAERSLLQARIAHRVEQMYADGLLEEVEALLAAGVLSETARQAIGYAEAIGHLAGELSEAAAKERTVVRTRRLAKRQMTWLRHQAEIDWVEVSSGVEVEELAGAVEELWRKNGATAVRE